LKALFRKGARHRGTSHAIVINTLEDELMGFLLTYLPSTLSLDGVYEGECVFLIWPQEAALLDTHLYDELGSYKDHGEHKVKLAITGGRREYTIYRSNLPVLGIYTDEQGQGTLVHEGTEEEPIAKIICLPPESKGVA
jgi:hypothetical protein